MPGAPPIQLTILRRGDLNIVDVAALGSLIPRSETRVEAALLAELATELRDLGAATASRVDGATGAESVVRDLVRVGGLIFSHLLTEPARLRLRAADPGDLHLRLDEELIHIPWELCHDGDTFLASKFRVGRQMITGQAIPEASTGRPRRDALRLLVVADPTGSLPAAGRAAEQLCARLDGVPGLEVTLLGGRRARRIALLAALADHDLVHFAGYSRYDAATPSRSGWCLDEGVLTAGELSKLRPAPLLVFSNAGAAGTAAESSDGSRYDADAFGIGSAFLLSGIQSYVGTFWVAHDEESVLFASTCYGALAGGATLGAALQRARRAVLDRRAPRGLAWASHLLYGDPTFAPLPAGVARSGVSQGRARSAPERPRRADESGPAPGRDAAPAGRPVGVDAGHVVGRGDQIARLHRRLDAARHGTRGVVFVSGPAGIGKTAVVDAFLDGVRGAGDAWIAQGQAVEQYGSGEAYLPVLQAWSNLAKTARDAPLLALMRRHAPSWLVQLAGLLPAADVAALQRGAHGTTRERMAREMAELIEAVSAERPLVLVLEDIHWSDHSTLELIAYVAERRDPARVLLIATYRPAETMRREHPSRAVTQELLTRRRAEEVRVGPLSADEVGDYLRARLGGSVDAALPSQVHRRTEGHPLFVVTLVDWALREGVLREAAGRWALSGDASALDSSTPESVRQAIERQIEALDPAEQRALEAASIAGGEFSVAAAAAALETETDALEERCEALVWRGQFLVAAGVEEWPDGTLAGRYRFSHALFLDVLAQRIGEARRVRMHRRIAERKEAAFGPRAQEIAGELAAHFAAARDPVRAVAYHRLAGDNAIERHADHEAVEHLTQALQLLDGLPDGVQRCEQELALLVKLTTPLMSTKGYASREVEHVFERAHSLSRQVAEGPHLFPLLRGLVSFYQVRGQSPTARIVGEELLARSEHTGDDLALVQAHAGHGVTLYDLVELDAAQSHLERALALYDPSTHARHVSIYGGYDPGVACRSWLALVEWLRGRPDRAVDTSNAAVALGTSLGHPHSLCRAHLAAATLHLFRRDPRLVREHVVVAHGIAHAEGFSFMAALAGALEGGALFFEGRLAEAVTRLREALDGFRATASEMSRPIFLGVLGVATALSGDLEGGLRQIDQALAEAEQTQQRLHLVTLNRFRGQLLLGAGDAGEAEACLQRSLTLARHLGTRMLELQAANSLAWMWHARGRGAEARAMVAPIHASFAEGLDLPDLNEAKALLALA